MPIVFRKFEDTPAERSGVPLIVGIAGCSGSGKTYSMLELLTGMQEVIGGDIYVIDTEHRRAEHYAEIFKFRHVNFDAPFGSLDYLAAIEHCVAKGAKIIGLDSMTHEHSGPGGRMWQSEEYLDKKCGDNEECRQKNFASSLKKPSRERLLLNTRITQLGINAVFCYRAKEGIEIKPGKGIQNTGWEPETTSSLVYDMQQMFLLRPGSDGKPDFKPEKESEKLMVKTPAQFRDWFTPGMQLNRGIGRRMAEWARGAQPAPKIEPVELPEAWATWTNEERGMNRANAGVAAFREWWKTLTTAEKEPLKKSLPDWQATAEKKP